VNRFVYGLSKWITRPTLWLFGRARAHGSGHVPATGGVLLVANHASFLDPPLLGSYCPRPVHFVMRSSLFGFWPLRWWFRQVGVIALDREGSARGAFAAGEAALREGKVLCIFPEGTRTRDGRVGPFKRGLQLLVERTQATVVPVGLRGTYAAWPPHRRLPRPRRLAVHFGSPCSPASVLAEGGLLRLRQQVVALCGESAGEGIAGRDTSAADSPHSAPVQPDGPAAASPRQMPSSAADPGSW
jgi:1-acyl-sn-glycerol-3-phosphate acyltransferase